MHHDKTAHQQKQIEIINEIERQNKTGSLKFSTVEPVKDFAADPRICLTSVHFPRAELLNKVSKIINELQNISPNHYYYRRNSLHLTIKNIRIVHDPPNFTPADVAKVRRMFSQVIPKHQSFYAYFYRLMLFPYNLALIGASDSELDNIHLELDRKLKQIGIPDDKIYINNKYFFCNMTLARFNSKPTPKFISKVADISNSLELPPYLINTVTLIKTNASLNYCQKIKTWKLKKLI